MKVKIISIITILALLISIMPSLAFADSNESFIFKVNGNEIKLTTGSAYVDNDKIMVPVRGFSEALGFNQINYDVHTKEIKIYLPHQEGNVILTLDEQRQTNKIIYYPCPRPANNAIQMDRKPIVKNGATYVPLEYIAKAFGYKFTDNFIDSQHEINLYRFIAEDKIWNTIDTEFTIRINGKDLSFPDKEGTPYFKPGNTRVSYQDITMIPLKPVMKELGFEVTLIDSKTIKITGKSGEKNLQWILTRNDKNEFSVKLNDYNAYTISSSIVNIQKDGNIYMSMGMMGSILKNDQDYTKYFYSDDVATGYVYLGSNKYLLCIDEVNKVNRLKLTEDKEYTDFLKNYKYINYSNFTYAGKKYKGFEYRPPNESTAGSGVAELSFGEFQYDNCSYNFTIDRYCFDFSKEAREIFLKAIERISGSASDAQFILDIVLKDIEYEKTDSTEHYKKQDEYYKEYEEFNRKYVANWSRVGNTEFSIEGGPYTTLAFRPVQ